MKFLFAAVALSSLSAVMATMTPPPNPTDCTTNPDNDHVYCFYGPTTKVKEAWSVRKGEAETKTFVCPDGETVTGQLATFQTLDEAMFITDESGDVPGLINNPSTGRDYAWIASMQMSNQAGTGTGWFWTSPNYMNEPLDPVSDFWNSKNMQPDDSPNDGENGEQDCAMLLYVPSNDAGDRLGWSDESCEGESFTSSRYIVEFDCSEDTGMMGDPHVKQWSGKWFGYQGECDLVLIDAPAIDLKIHVRTTIRYSYSYIETAAIQLGDDILEVGSYGQYFFNGVDSADLSSINGFPLKYTFQNKKRSKFDIVLSESTNITITTMKDIVSVNIHGGTAKNFGDSVGLMGSFNGELKMRDGTVVAEASDAVGQEWQVTADEPHLFQAIRAPQAPTEQCRLPEPLSAEAQRMLGENKVTNEQAEEACAHVKGPAHEACVSDALLFGDLDIAGVY